MKKSNYYTEFGIKISTFRLSVRFPTGHHITKANDQEPAGKKVIDNQIYSDWKWIPGRIETSTPLSSPSKTSKTSKTGTARRNPSTALPPPPVPPRSASPSSQAPTSAIPPYPSSTVTRRPHRDQPARQRCWSYV
jgi:hypothetical protein